MAASVAALAYDVEILKKRIDEIQLARFSCNALQESARAFGA